MGQRVAHDLSRTIHQFFPDLSDRLETVTDPRVRHDYTMTEILLGGVSMFLCKEGSRNAMNNDRGEAQFRTGFESLFGERLPHMDTVDDVLRKINNNELEELKATLVAKLIEKKVFNKFRLDNGAYRVAVDATGVMAVNEGHCDHCLTKTSKNGVVSYFHNVLEAKLITPNGFALSLATEWIENKGDYDKQDCELKAFGRLAWKLKKFFPRLPICLHADGLYTNKTFFDICAQHHWGFITTFKDGNLKSVWEEIEMELLTSDQELRVEQKDVVYTYRWLNHIDYRGHQLAWVECIETRKDIVQRFVFVTSMPLKKSNIAQIAASGRLRFKIENEGFNTQKNLGYRLQHKYSRVSYNGMKNYVCLMQIAHMLNQLYELSSLAKPLLTKKITIKYLWKRMLSALLEGAVSSIEDYRATSCRFQIRYE